MRRLRLLLVVCVATVAQSTPSNAQATLADLRAACADDAKKLCAGVPLGGGRMVACLKEHKDQLSDRCKQAAGVPMNKQYPCAERSEYAARFGSLGSRAECSYCLQD